MRPKTEEMVRKAHDFMLSSTHHVRAKDIAKYCHISTTAVYRIIKLLRLNNVGILPVHKGYILSECATKIDDVEFLRRANGRRTSDFLSVKAAEKDILQRWNSISDRRDMKLILSPLTSSVNVLRRGMKILLSKNGKLL